MIENVHTKRLVNEGVKIAQTKGESFLKGKDTTAFSNLGKNAVEFGAKIAGAGALTYDVTKSLTNGDVEAMVKAMASEAISTITSEIGSLIGEYTGKATSLVASIPSKIAEKTARRITKPDTEHDETHIMTLGEWLTEATAGQETLREVQHTEQKVKRKTEKVEQAQEYITKAVKKANSFMEKANSRIKYIEKYALEGPEWTSKQMSDTIDDVILEVRKEIDEEYVKLDNLIDKFCETEGNNLGSYVVDQTNKTLHNLATKIKNQNEEVITQGKIKAKSVLQKGKLYIMGRFGINIPIPVSLD